MAIALGAEPVIVEPFAITVVEIGGYFFARIRRIDQMPITRRGESHAAIGTKPCLTAFQAFAEARGIIAQGDLR